MRARRGLTGFLLLGWIATAIFAGVQTVRVGWLEREVTRRAMAGTVSRTEDPVGTGYVGTSAGDASETGGEGDATADNDFWLEEDAGNDVESDQNADSQFMKQLVDNALASMMASPEPENARKTRRQLKKEMLLDLGNMSKGGAGASSAAGTDGAASGSVPGDTGQVSQGDRKGPGKAPAVDPRSLQLAQQAKDAQKLGDFDRALDLYRQSIETDPKNRTAYQAMGALQKRLGLYEGELATYQQWAEQLPGDPTARYLMADAYARSGATDLALGQLEQFLEMAGDDLRVYPMAADLYRRMGMPEAEQAVLEQWVAAAPQSPDALNALAGNYRRQGNYAAAEQAYNTLLQARPEDAEVRARLSALYQQQGRYAEALQQLDEAVAMRPNDVRLLSQLAETRRRAGDLDGAIGAYEQVIASQPGSEAALNAERNITRLERQLERAQTPRPPKAPKPPRSR
ncbi:MAG TPA: tetratricopeptide repeat protein [Candidatus Hydrogenedentes bacterium]|nr:tetratricopeptide repeat protein [Candidatus Hydrogenedentota bacterium]